MRDSIIMNTISELYIDEILKNLKNGHASVLVGAGFSMNADRIDGANKKMPSWNELSDSFCKLLGIDIDDPVTQKENRYMNPLTLAQQVEEMYGKPYLNDFLRKIMDDDAYQPGKAHKNLVALPWSDIFTTNYDTLLERAYQVGYDRRYKVVYSHGDLLYSSGSPRIVKLHGSFPSYEPFIISEEDYRKYPDVHAPFVNTVQQALLENVFVLIGFSGSDPNFLKWIGWIHDNLGLKNAPRIYMVIFKPEKPVAARMLASKNIDLVVLQDTHYWKEGMKYRETIEEFLDDLYFKTRDVDRHDNSWPRFIGRHFDATVEDMLKKLQQLHDEYPGWIVPKITCLGISRTIISDAEFTIAKCANKGKAESETAINKNEVALCSEFCWMLKMTGVHVHPETIENLVKILKNNGALKDSEHYINTQLYILRYYRIKGDKRWEKLFQELYGKIDLIKRWDDDYATLCHENAMQKLYTFKWEALNDAVALIPTDNEHCEWILRKAGLLGSLGRYDDAIELLKNGIERVRFVLLRTDRNNASYNKYTSYDSCMLTLLNIIKRAMNAAEGRIEPYMSALRRAEDRSSEKNGLEERYSINELSDWNYDKEDFSWNYENEKYVARMTDTYLPRPSVTQTPTFDVGTVITKHHFGEDIIRNESFEYLSFRENTGIPLNIGCISICEGVKGTVSRLSWISRCAAMFWAIFSGQKDAVQVAFSRKNLAAMETSETDELCKELIALIKYANKHRMESRKKTLFDQTLRDYALTTIPEALSHLASKCSQDCFDELFDLIVEIYTSNNPESLSGVDNLVKRVISMVSYDTLLRNIHKLWMIDIKIDDAYMNSSFPDPFNEVYSRVLSQNRKYETKMSHDQEKKYLEWINKSKDAKYKKNALIRITCIFMIYKLSDELESKLKEALWSDDNLDSFGLPDLGNFFKVIADEFPHDRDKEVILQAEERFVVSKYQDCIANKTIKDSNNLFHMSVSLLKKINVDADKLEKIIEMAYDFCQMVYNESVFAFGVIGLNPIAVLGNVDSVLGFAILKSGLADEKRALNSDVLNKIIDILDKQDVPHSLLSWCNSVENRYDWVTSSVLHPGLDYINNANNTMYYLVENGIGVDEKMTSIMLNAYIATLTYNVNAYAIGIEYLIRKDILDKEQCDTISAALPKFEVITRIDIDDDDDDVMKKIGMRKISSVMAKTLNKWYCDKGIKIPEGVDYWASVSSNASEFAEIRIVWDE